MELWLSRHVSSPLYHVNTCRLAYVMQRKAAVNLYCQTAGCVQSSEQPNGRIFLLINPVAIHGLGIQSFSFILLRLVLTLNEFRIYKVINVGLS